MGEQRLKPLARSPHASSLEEVWGRTSAYVVPRPNKIMLVRHGESEGNSDDSVYTRVSDWRISLTQRGRQQARAAGSKLKELAGASDVFFYYR
eukprot:747253-Hanusia_phi.AAC.6